jgi:hypothetical protein
MTIGWLAMTVAALQVGSAEAASSLPAGGPIPCSSQSVQVDGPTSGSIGTGLILHAELDVIAGGYTGACTYRYQISMWTGYNDEETGLGNESETTDNDGTAAPELITANYLRIRVWRCGTLYYSQAYYAAATDEAATYVTPAYNYGNCGPQADDYNSAIWNWYTGVGPAQTYVHVG